MLSFLEQVHSDPRIALLTILIGFFLGLALVLTDWKSKFKIGGLLATGGGFLTTLTAEKVQTVKQLLSDNSILSPILYGLNIALGTFMVVLIGSTGMVFIANYIEGKRKNDPETLDKAVRRATSIFGNGLLNYITSQPDIVAQNRIRDLEKHKEVISYTYKDLVEEVVGNARGRQHFLDTVDPAGRLFLQRAFGDSANLQHFRMAIFEKKGKRLEYLVAINNRDWTEHSLKGFDISNCFMGEVIRLNRPLVYPRDKKLSKSYEKRPQSRYQSFVAMPFPCGQGPTKNLGVITVDYTGKDEVFTELRIEELFVFAQFAYALYMINIQEVARN